MVKTAKANKKSLSFVQAMRQVSATNVTPLILANVTVRDSDRRKRIEATNILRKRTSTTTTTITPIPVLNSAPTAPVVYTGGGGGGSTSSSSTSATPVATPVPVTTTVSTPVTTTVSSPVSAPVVVAPTAPAPVAPVVVAPPAPIGTTPLNIVNPQNPNLAKLAEYQRVMGGSVADNLMIFMNMPQSAAGIDGASYYMANIMNEYAKYGITPIFVFEPTGDNGAQLDLGKLKNGDYSANMELLFSKIKNDRKVTEDKLGLMVPYPEINTPAFNRANFVPENLPTMVNIFFDSIKKSYPNVKGGLLLDAKSYDVDKSWGQGVARSFAPYVTGIKPGYIQTFGLQGFPWASNDASVKVYDPTVFLPTGITAEAANILGTKNIWFNTGTMKRQYPTNTVNVSPAERTTTYNGIINQATALQSQGYTMMVHIFAQDKFSMGEGIDWSYIENASDGVLSAHEGVFATFLKQTQSKGIKVGLFDI